VQDVVGMIYYHAILTTENADRSGASDPQLIFDKHVVPVVV